MSDSTFTFTQSPPPAAPAEDDSLTPASGDGVASEGSAEVSCVTIEEVIRRPAALPPPPGSGDDQPLPARPAVLAAAASGASGKPSERPSSRHEEEGSRNSKEYIDNGDKGGHRSKAAAADGPPVSTIVRGSEGSSVSGCGGPTGAGDRFPDSGCVLPVPGGQE